MNKKVLSDFQKYIDVNSPIIYINDFDFARVDEIIQSVIGGKKVFEWNPATGTTDFVNRNSRGLGVEQSLVHFLREQYTIEIDESMPIREKFLVLREIQDYIDDPEIRTLLALIAQRKLYDRRFETTIIIVSSINKVPSEIAQYVTFLDIEYPHEEEINALINDHIEVNDYTSFEESDREKLMPSLQGLTAYEIDRILDMAMSNNGSLSAEDKEMILRQKKGMVKKSGLVELIDTPESLDSIGGLDDLKNYLKEKANIFHNLSEALKYGVSMPKGVFLVGMPGCGKSLCAKAAARVQLHAKTDTRIRKGADAYADAQKYQENLGYGDHGAGGDFRRVPDGFPAGGPAGVSRDFPQYGTHLQRRRPAVREVRGPGQCEDR